MQLSFEPFDGRSWNSVDVLDEGSNRIVGKIRSQFSSYPGIEISLFDQSTRLRLS
jgi:hypothetical protein